MIKTKSRIKKETSDTLIKEISASILFAVGIFSSLSLFFYSSKTELDVKGAMGTIGFFISDILGKSFGICSFIIPLIFLFIAYLIFSQRSGIYLYRMTIALIIFLFSATTFLALATGNDVILGYTPPGGLVGESISALLREKIAGTLGSYIIVTILIFISLINVSNLSLRRVINYIDRLVLFLINQFVSLLKLISALLRDIFYKIAIMIKTNSETFKSSAQAKRNDSIAVKANSEFYIQRTLPLPNIIIETQENRKDNYNYNERSGKEDFDLPDLILLDPKTEYGFELDKDTVYENARLIEEKLSDFGVSGKVTEIRPGPVITMFEYKPSPGIKINKIASLSNDLAMVLSALSIRIIAPIPGKDVIGIEVPNAKRETVVLRELLEDEKFINSKSKLTIALGKDISGKPFYMDLRKAPHLMIAGTTGSGKSVFLHTIITSLLYKANPFELKFIMIDPKMLELSIYNDIPHLLKATYI